MELGKARYYMSDVKHAVKMLTAALRDFKALSNMLNKELFDDEVFGFHAQQSFEKALKAWLSYLGINYFKTHNLDELLDLLRKSGQIVPESYDDLTFLTEYAVSFRYDSIDYFEEDLDRKLVYHNIESIIKHIKGIIDHS